MTVRPSTKHDIQRDDENTTRPGFSVVQKILVTGSIFAESTGADSGTGDVLLLVSGTVTNGDNHNHVGGDGAPIPEAIASAITLGSNKNPPVVADSLAINDTEDGNSFKRLTLGTLRSFFKTNYDGFYAPITGAFVQDEGVIRGRVTTFNFVGSPIDVSVSGSVARIFVTGSSGSGGGVQLSTDSPRVYTNSGTWSKPAGLQYVIVEVVGGGGGGGAAEGTASEAAMGGPGGGGEYAKGRLDTGDLGSTENISVGAGGSAGATPSGNGGAGGTSSFGSHITAAGGNGGDGHASSTSVPRSGANGGDGGTGGSGGDIRVAGDGGWSGIIFSVTAAGLSGVGGGNPLGGRVRSGSTNIAGVAGLAYGGGGMGGRTANSATDRAGAAGANGVVIVWEYVSG